MDSKPTNNHSNISLFFEKRLRLVYLLFLFIPLAYYFLWGNQAYTHSGTAKHLDYMGFSVKSTSPARLSIVENEQELMAWDINSNAYKNLEFVGKLDTNKDISLKAEKLNSNDTLFFLGFNIYSNNKLFSLGDDINQHITVTNARLAEKDGVLILIVEKSGIPLNIKLKSPTKWGRSDPFNSQKSIILFVFLAAFLLMMLANPSTRYVLLSLILAIFILVFSYFTDTHSNGRVTLSTSSRIKNAEIFYSQSPFFSATKRYSSGIITDVFSQPVNLETEKYLRFDIGDSLIALEQIKIKISAGIFSKSYNLNELPQNRLMLNDLVLEGNTYYVTGNDPYIKFSSAYFINKLEFVLFLEHNKFLFLTLIIFLIFISLHGLVDKKLNKLKLKPAYLAFLLIPLSYYLINQQWIKKSVPPGADYLYFSVKTTRPSVFTLINGSDSLGSRTVDSPGFKYLQFKGKFNINENFFLKIENLSQQDTISFLSINLFHDNKTYSLFEKNSSVCKISNARYTGQSNDVEVTVKNSGLPVIVSLLPSNLLKDNDQENKTNAAIVFIFFITFIFVLIFSPNQRFIIVSSFVTSLMMFLFFWICNDAQSQLTLSTSSLIKRADFFYNNNPDFQSKRMHLDNKSKNLYEFQIYPSEFKFYRCDIGENDDRIKNLFIITKTGILRNHFDYRTISSGKILLNDMVRRGEDYQVCGNDPFVAFSSSFQINKMHFLFLIRQNLFFLISISLFLILIIVNKIYNKVKLPNFFLVIFFLVFIFIGLIIHLFNSENLILLAEKRHTNPLPAFQTDSSIVYTKELNNYILDQLPGRKNIIRMNNLLQYAVFKQIINYPVIYFGEDGWMFFIGGPAKDNYENRQPLTHQDLEKLKNVLEQRNEWLKKRGIHFYMIFPPMAQTVYEEYVGQRMRRYYKQTKCEQLLEYLKLNTDLDIIDLYTPIMEAKDTSSRKLYFNNNCHWNFFGGYVAYYTMINYIKKDFPNIGEPLTSKDFKWVETKNYNPDLFKLMDIDMFYTSTEYSPLFTDNIITDTIYPFYLDLWTPAPPACVRTKRTSYPTMLMYGDSYAGSILPFLFCNFSKTYFIWTPLFQPLIIEKEKPDMVIQEMVDMSINALLLKNKPFPELKDTIPEKLE